MGSVRLEESGEWSGGVPECRTAHAAHQQRVERGGRRPAPNFFFSVCSSYVHSRRRLC